MKKILNIMFIAMAIIATTSCGSSSRMSNGSYSGKGESFSFDKNIAHEKAFINAVNDATKNYETGIKSQATQIYAGTEGARGKASERLSYESSISTSTKVNANDITERFRFKWTSKGWRCICRVQIDPENIN